MSYKEYTLSIKNELIIDNIKLFLLLAVFLNSIRAWFFWELHDINKLLSLIYFIMVLFTINKIHKLFIPVIILYIYFGVIEITELYELYGYVSFSIIFIFFYLNEKESIKEKAFCLIESVMGYVFALGLIGYFINLFYQLPFTLLPSNNILIAYWYKNYIVFVQQINISNVIFGIRFSSIFDEPGVVGTLCLYFLAIRNYKLSSWKQYIILLAGLVSLSIYFYLGSIIMLIIISKFRIRELIITSLTFLLLFIFFNSNPLLEEMILLRLKLDDKGIAGDNRTTTSWDNHYSFFERSEYFYFGKGSQSTQDLIQYDGVASYQTFIYKYGIVGLILFSLIYFYLLKKQTSFYNSFLLFVIIISVLYQRPWIFEQYNSILLFSGSIIMNNNKNILK